MQLERAQGAPFCLMGTSNLLAMYRLASSKHTFCADGTDSALGRVYAALQPDMPPPPASSAADAKASSSCSADRVLQAQRCRVRSTVLLPLFDLRAAAERLGLGGAVQQQQLTAEEASAVVLPAAVFELAAHEPLLDFDAAVRILNQALEPEGLAVPQLCRAQAVATGAQQLGELPCLNEEPEAEDEEARAARGRGRRQSAPPAAWSGAFPIVRASSGSAAADTRGGSGEDGGSLGVTAELSWGDVTSQQGTTDEAEAAAEVVAITKQQPAAGQHIPGSRLAFVAHLPNSPSPMPRSPSPGPSSLLDAPAFVPQASGASRTRRWSCMRAGGATPAAAASSASSAFAPAVPWTSNFSVEESAQSTTLAQSAAFIVTEYYDLDGGDVEPSWWQPNAAAPELQATDGEPLVLEHGNRLRGAVAPPSPDRISDGAKQAVGPGGWLGSFDTPMRRVGSVEPTGSSGTIGSGASAAVAAVTAAVARTASDWGGGGSGRGESAERGKDAGMALDGGPQPSSAASSSGSKVAEVAAAVAAAVRRESQVQQQHQEAAKSTPLPSMNHLNGVDDEAGGGIGVGSGLRPLATLSLGGDKPSSTGSGFDVIPPAGMGTGTCTGTGSTGSPLSSLGTAPSPNETLASTPPAARGGGQVLPSRFAGRSAVSEVHGNWDRDPDALAAAVEAPAQRSRSGSSDRMTPGRRLSEALKSSFHWPWNKPKHGKRDKRMQHEHSPQAAHQGEQQQQQQSRPGPEQQQHAQQQQYQQQPQQEQWHDGGSCSAGPSRSPSEPLSDPGTLAHGAATRAASVPPAPIHQLQLQTAPSTPPVDRLRVVLAHGGAFVCTRAQCLYEGGSKKLVTINCGNGLRRLREQVAVAVGGGVSAQVRQ